MILIKNMDEGFFYFVLQQSISFGGMILKNRFVKSNLEKRLNIGNDKYKEALRLYNEEKSKYKEGKIDKRPDFSEILEGYEGK